MKLILTAFCVYPTGWNLLPDYFRDPLLSKETFKQSLKTYLFALY